MGFYHQWVIWYLLGNILAFYISSPTQTSKNNRRGIFAYSEKPGRVRQGRSSQTDKDGKMVQVVFLQGSYMSHHCEISYGSSVVLLCLLASKIFT